MNASHMHRYLVYVLAAGRGSRSGGPKAWESHEGTTLLERQLGFLSTLFPAKNIAVTIQGEWLERCRKLNPDVLWVPVEPDASALGALQALLKARALEFWAFLYHVDMPVWEPELFQTLAGRTPFEGQGEFEAIVPVHEGKGGHPVLLSPALKETLESLNPAADRLDVFLRGRSVLRTEVSSARVLENWNQ